LTDAPPIEPTRESIDNAISMITKAIQSADIKTIPGKKIFTESTRPLPPHIVKTIKEKRRLRKRVQKHGENWHKPYIGTLKRRIQKEIEAYDREYLEKIWEDSTKKDQHGYFHLAKNLLKSKSQVNQLST